MVLPLEAPQTLVLPLEAPQTLVLPLEAPQTLVLPLEADLWNRFRLGSSSLSSDHCVLFFGTVSLGTTVALDGGCAPGGDNTLGTEVVLGNGAVFTVPQF